MNSPERSIKVGSADQPYSIDDQTPSLIPGSPGTDTECSEADVAGMAEERSGQPNGNNSDPPSSLYKATSLAHPPTPTGTPKINVDIKAPNETGEKTTTTYDDSFDIKSPQFFSDELDDGLHLGSVEISASELSPELAELDSKANALLESFRTAALTPKYKTDQATFFGGNKNNQNSISECSYQTDDDDDIGGEMRRLGSHTESLRNDLADVDEGLNPLVRDSPPLDRESTFQSEQLQQHTSSNLICFIWIFALLWAIGIVLRVFMTYVSTTDKDSGLVGNLLLITFLNSSLVLFFLARKA
uniref:Uncharacterized protein n=1 Tax=Attheya septentrionalis TaxID=420275 RepID=A0A7S2UMY4_9STRA|mmetsp:Transcript_5274/g.9274  ORF Transcript_5274/g.9274 Transcript_5274/m.9274 type:complete len:301 (+) Transcript_5274:128-1030(+)